MSVSDRMKSVNLKELTSLAVTFFMPAVVVFVWVSLPLLLMQLGINLFYLGVIYSIGILGSLLLRVPIRFYLERGRKDILPMMAMLFAGISLSLFYISINIYMVILAFLLLSIAASMYRTVKTRKQDRNLRNTEPIRNMFSQDIVSTFGIFTLLMLSGLFPENNVLNLYGIVSVLALLVGFLSLSYALSTRPQQMEYVQKSSFKDLFGNAIAPLKSIDMVVNRKVVFPFLTIQALIYLSICIAAVFLPAMALKDNIVNQDIFLIFGAFSIIGYLLDKVAQKISFQPLREVFYMFRPVFLIVPFLILSIVISSLLFIAGYFIILLWIFSDSASSDIMLKSMGEGDQIRSRILISFLSVPISIVGPLLGAAMWAGSPRLLFGVAIIPAAISMLIVMLMLERSQGVPSTHTT